MLNWTYVEMNHKNKLAYWLKQFHASLIFTSGATDQGPMLQNFFWLLFKTFRINLECLLEYAIKSLLGTNTLCYNEKS